MNQHLKNKENRYEVVASSECFLRNLVGLAAIELNVTELCSRRCPFCPRYDSSVYKNQDLHMSLETVTSLAKQCQQENYVGDITLVGFGEPMLHKDLPSIVRILRTHLTNYIHIITNGDFLTPQSLKELIDAGLDKIIVSCYDGPKDKEKFEKLLSQFSIDYHLKELWIDQNRGLEQVVKSNNFNNRTGLVPIPITESGKQCYVPFYKLFIDWNGDVVLCSNDWHRKEKGLGNINTNTLREIWFGEKLTSIRNNLRMGNRCDKACKDCHVKGTLIGKTSFDLLS